MNILPDGPALVLNENLIGTVDEDVGDAGIVKPLLQEPQQPPELTFYSALRLWHHHGVPARIASR